MDVHQMLAKVEIVINSNSKGYFQILSFLTPIIINPIPRVTKRKDMNGFG